MSDLTSSIFGLHANALSLRQQRIDLIASNIANADTPGYKAQDLDFTSALQLAAGKAPGMDAQGQLALTQANGEAAEAGLDISQIGHQARFQRDELQPALDGNTVDSQLEHAAFAKAALEYRVSLNFLEGRARSLMLAITGQ